MSDSYLDHIPSLDRERIRKRMRSEAEYEALRERVKGPEDLEREMERNDRTADLSFRLETEPRLHEELKQRVERDVAEQGIENVTDVPPSPDAKKAVERGKFRLTVKAHPATHVDQLTIVAEGNVQESLPIKPSLSDRYVGQTSTSD